MKYAIFSYGYTHDGKRCYQMMFRCGETIDCRPPYIRGKMDSVWVGRLGPLPKTTDQTAIRNLAGMKILPLAEGGSQNHRRSGYGLPKVQSGN